MSLSAPRSRDRTGTLTTNTMCVRKVLLMDASATDSSRPGGARAASCLVELEVDGNDYAPEGAVRLVGDPGTPKYGGGDDFAAANGNGGGGGTVSRHPAAEFGALEDLARVASLCNEARVSWDPDNRRYARTGEPTEARRSCPRNTGLQRKALRLHSCGPDAHCR